MEKGKLERVLQMIKKSGIYTTGKTTAEVTVFVGSAVFEKRMSLFDICSMIKYSWESGQYEEFHNKYWCAAYDGEWVMYRSPDVHVSVYIDLKTLNFGG